MTVAASDPGSITECIDLVNRLCVMLDTNKDDTEFKKTRRVDNDHDNDSSNGNGNGNDRGRRANWGRKDNPQARTSARGPAKAGVGIVAR